MFSIVIRNKNESKALETVLFILDKIYKSDIEEIIIVDNNSTDESIDVAKRYNCKIVTIDDFSYGRASNLGISEAKSNYVLLLSAHAIPIGANFFKNITTVLSQKENIAGIRFINSIENYKRAVKNDFKVVEPLKYGLMTACAIINKRVWENHKIDENLVFSEDKHWSDIVVKAGYEILDLNETFFYFVKRNEKSDLNRFKNETIAEYQLSNKRFPGYFLIVLSFFKKIFIVNQINYFKTLKKDFLMMKIKFEINNKLRAK